MVRIKATNTTFLEINSKEISLIHLNSTDLWKVSVKPKTSNIKNYINPVNVKNKTFPYYLLSIE